MADERIAEGIWYFVAEFIIEGAAGERLLIRKLRASFAGRRKAGLWILAKRSDLMIFRVWSNCEKKLWKYHLWDFPINFYNDFSFSVFISFVFNKIYIFAKDYLRNNAIYNTWNIQFIVITHFKFKRPLCVRACARFFGEKRKLCYVCTSR